MIVSLMPTFIHEYTYYYYSMSIFVSTTIFGLDGEFDSNFGETITIMIV
jgi:hypothetical protein